MQALAAMTAFFWVLAAAGWSYGEPLGRADPVYLHATIAALVAIVVMQVANVFICRSPRSSIFALAPFTNRLTLVGILVEIAIIVLIVYTCPGNSLFRHRTSDIRGVVVARSFRARDAGHGGRPQVADAPGRACSGPASQR
jgi:magnesium-transporting ATPase (P-type)